MTRPCDPCKILTNLGAFALIFALFLVSTRCTRKPPKSVLADVAPEQRALEIQKHYLLRCSSCHGQFGEGTIGPNLTDDYWIYGEGTKADLVKMIADGVVAKGMPAWKNVFHADDISLLADFVQSLQGTQPKKAKAPQGKKIVTTIEIVPAVDPKIKTRKIPTH